LTKFNLQFDYLFINRFRTFFLSAMVVIASLSTLTDAAVQVRRQLSGVASAAELQTALRVSQPLVPRALAPLICTGHLRLLDTRPTHVFQRIAAQNLNQIGQ
jgi:hypothetical protein